MMRPMTESVYTAGLPAKLPQQPANHRGRTQPSASFQHAFHQASAGHEVHRVVARAPAGVAPKPCPAASLDALNQAMTREGVPAAWQPELAFIMAHESGGRVDAKSPVHSARGLYQLTAVNYHYNPRGAASFGDAVEEAQGGIRYIRARYGTAESAAAHWRQHRWY
jgi:hypothetical protein